MQNIQKSLEAGQDVTSELQAYIDSSTLSDEELVHAVSALELIKEGLIEDALFEIEHAVAIQNLREREYQDSTMYADWTEYSRQHRLTAKQLGVN